MSGVWGNQIKISIFGESHGKAIGIVCDGLPSGVALDFSRIEEELARRAPGRDKLSTARKESDTPQVLSGLFEGKTTGTPLAVMIENTDMKSKDYSKTKDLARPGHADYTGAVRYNGFNDYRGGGHFSGRITAPLVFAGAVAKQILEQKGIQVGAHISHIAGVSDTPFTLDNLHEATFEALRTQALPVLDATCIEAMQEAVYGARAEGDSVGGVIECAIIGVPAGVGDPFFDSVESRIAQLAFSVPAVKGISFGKGFALTYAKGSEANDAYCIKEGKVQTKTNHNGGVLGGITNGMPVTFQVAIKPTPSIAKAQETINMATQEETTLCIEGRHDPCIVQRAVVVIEAIAALAILDLL